MNAADYYFHLRRQGVSRSKAAAHAMQRYGVTRSELFSEVAACHTFELPVGHDDPGAHDPVNIHDVWQHVIHSSVV